MALSANAVPPRVVAFIPVRGGSKSIPGKNIRLLAGQPLLHWTCRAALGAHTVSQTFVCTDSDDIAAVARQIVDAKLAVIGRSPETATDTATTESALLEFARATAFDVVVLVQATSPLLRSDDLDGALEKMEREGWDSILSVTREHRFRWEQDKDGAARPANYDPASRPRRQDWGGEMFENGAFYITRRSALLDSGCRVSGRIGAWEMPPETRRERDEPQDWLVADALLRRRAPAGDLAARCRAVKLVLTDVDGVLTDSGMYYDNSGDCLRKFNTRDGKAVELLRAAGIMTGLLSSEESEAVRKRAAKLRMDVIRLGVSDKCTAITALMAELGLSREEIAFIGDDVNDTRALAMVGLSACPADAHADNLGLVHFRSPLRGGEGCLRDFAELILNARAA